MITMTSPFKIFIDRSRYEQAQRCLRSRYLEYHFGGTGITSSRKPLPLAVGSSVHEGLAYLLANGEACLKNERLREENSLPSKDWFSVIEDSAVAVALADFAEYQNALDPPDAERAIIEPSQSEINAAVGAETDAPLHAMDARRNEFDDYLFREQSALVEAMVRAYARRRLRPLLEEFEVLEVEREGKWKLGEYTVEGQGYDPLLGIPREWMELWFMSRPDALLRHRQTNQLYIQSYKTAASWDMRKEKDAQHDMQGLSEGIEIERRLGQWWDVIQHAKETHTPVSMGREADCPPAMQRYLFALDAPPRIHAVRMEYLLKSERWVDKDLSMKYGVEMRSQRSPLIRQYVAVSVPQRGVAGYSIGDVNCSWDFIREDGREGSLAWQNFKSRPVWEEPGGIKAWIDKLDDAAPVMSGEDSTMGLEPRQLGYKCDAQVTGYLKNHPLDAVFVPPLVIYRSDDALRDLVEQMEASERRIAEGVAAVNSAENADEVRHLLNINFPQTLRACSYPSQCQFVPICFGGEAIQHDPLGSGQFKTRRPNHPQEGENANTLKDS